MKKFISCIAALALTLPVVGMTPSYALTSVVLGDPNNDGSITPADAALVRQYIGGARAVSAYSFTAMDINEDGVVDKTDANIMLYKDAHHIPPTTVDKDLYTLPENTSRTYTKHNYLTNLTSTYTLSQVPSNSTNFNFPIETMNVVHDEDDQESKNVVKLVREDQFSDNDIASGFIVSEHVIATSADFLYNRSNGTFYDDVQVEIYNSAGTAVEATIDVVSCHIPSLYKTLSNADAINFDYALVYVGENVNLLNYASAWDFAVASKEFAEAGVGQATTVGYSLEHYSEGLIRHKSTGIAFEPTPDNYRNYHLNRILATNAMYTVTKRGGIMYYQSEYNYTVSKSAVAVTNNAGSIGTGSCGVRINPTLIKFYSQTTNLS